MSAESGEREERVEPSAESDFIPRGITLFLSIMLVVYALYWAYLWFVTTIQRGIGG